MREIECLVALGVDMRGDTMPQHVYDRRKPLGDDFQAVKGHSSLPGMPWLVDSVKSVVNSRHRGRLRGDTIGKALWGRLSCGIVATGSIRACLECLGLQFDRNVHGSRQERLTAVAAWS